MAKEGGSKNVTKWPNICREEKKAERRSGQHMRSMRQVVRRIQDVLLPPCQESIKGAI